MFFHQNLKVIRKAWGISQKDVADKFQVSQGTVSAWEQSTVPPLEVIISLADYFKITVDDLLKKEFTRQNAPERWGRREYPQQPDETVTENINSNDDDLRAEVFRLSKEVEQLKELFAPMGGSKLDVLQALQVITEHLEAGIEEKDYILEKKAYLEKMVAILSGGD